MIIMPNSRSVSPVPATTTSLATAGARSCDDSRCDYASLDIQAGTRRWVIFISN